MEGYEPLYQRIHRIGNPMTKVIKLSYKKVKSLFTRNQKASGLEKASTQDNLTQNTFQDSLNEETNAKETLKDYVMNQQYK